MRSPEFLIGHLCGHCVLRPWGGKPDQDCSIANINAVLCAGFSKTKVKQVDSRPLTKMGVGSSGFGKTDDVTRHALLRPERRPEPPLSHHLCCSTL